MGKEFIVTVFGSSRPREGEADYEEARILGRALAAARILCLQRRLRRGDGSSVPRSEGSGGKTTGVTADFFKAAKLNPWIDVEVRMKTWEERLLS